MQAISSIQSEELTQRVRLRAGICTNEEASAAVKAVLETLFECIPGALARELAGCFCAILAYDRPLSGEQITTAGERLSVSEFAQRVAWREGIGNVAAFRHARAVLPLLGSCLGFNLFERVRAELPLEFYAFWEANLEEVHMHQPLA
jgi:uncharacterized protein (DUF2267 family)